MPTDPTHTRPGLRERKKLATRRALHRAALDLATDRGIEVTVEEICALAEVSPRTFFNYFHSKEEAIIGDGPTPPSDDLLAVFEAGGPSGDLVDDLRDVMAEHLHATLPTRDEMHLRRRILDHDTDLAARFMGRFMAIERRLVLAVARRTDTATTDLDAQLLGAVAAAAMRVSVRRWAHSTTSDEDLPRQVHRVFDTLRTIATSDPTTVDDR